MVKAEDLKVGMGLRTWLGTHTIIGLFPYVGPFDFVLNIIAFSNGMSMSNVKGAVYETLTGDPAWQKGVVTNA